MTGAAIVHPEPIERYLAALQTERHLSLHTIAAYRRDLGLLVSLAAGAQIALAAVENSHVRKFIAHLHGKGLSGRSIARVLSGWRSFYRWWSGHDGGPHNPVLDTRAPKSGKRLPKALSQELAVELTATSAGEHLLGLRDHALFELLYSSGLRLSEIVGLDHGYRHEGRYRSAGWLDLEAGEVTVTGKGNKMRTVPVGSAAITAVKAWLSERGQWARADSDALFLTARGTRLGARSIQQRLKAHASRLGIPANVHPHMLRHSFASHVLQSSGDLRAVQEMLGHASIAATQVYTSLDFQHLAAVYDAAHPRAKKA